MVAVSGDGPPMLGRMEGHGFYSEHSQAQQAYGELGLGWLREAAAEIEPPGEPMPFVIADFGAADGGSSVEPMRQALAARRRSGPALVVHTDIPSNDFSALFELVESGPSTYLGPPGVFAVAVGRSFYQRLLPDSFLSLGWSSIAVHWLSKVPEPITDHIYCSFARGRQREALRGQSARDWTAFLGHRAHELRDCGRLIILGGAARDDGTSGAEGLMDAANDALRALVDAQLLRPDEYAQMTIPTWNRTAAEFVEPFAAGDLDGRLTLRRHTAGSLDDPYFETYRRSGDLDRYVDSVADFFRAAFEQSLWASLDSGRAEADRDAIAQAFGRQLRRLIANHPDRVACRWHVAVLDIAAT